MSDASGGSLSFLISGLHMSRESTLMIADQIVKESELENLTEDILIKGSPVIKKVKKVTMSLWGEGGGHQEYPF